jgi:hypothetical protein
VSSSASYLGKLLDAYFSAMYSLYSFVICSKSKYWCEFYLALLIIMNILNLPLRLYLFRLSSLWNMYVPYSVLIKFIPSFILYVIFLCFSEVSS